jgi:hypothetical protein
MIHPGALAAHVDLARAPMNIIELQGHDFAFPQTKAREQK